MTARRPLLLALLALAVPLPALALDGTGTPAGPASFSVSASLLGCGLAENAIACEIDVGWDPVEDADSYTLTVTAPDGSVTDYGETASGGTSVVVPYVGSGSYSVHVTAWGTPPGEDEPEVLARDEAGPQAEDRAHERTPPAPGSAEEEDAGETAEPSAGSGEDAGGFGHRAGEPGEEPAAEAPKPECETPAEPPVLDESRQDGSEQPAQAPASTTGDCE